MTELKNEDGAQQPQGGSVASVVRSWWQAPRYGYQNQNQQQQPQPQPPPRHQTRYPVPAVPHVAIPQLPPPPQRPGPIAFISGPLEVDQTYFFTYYLPKIRNAIAAGHSFNVGTSRGTDTLVFDYLLKSRVHPSRITLYFNTWEESKLRAKFRKFEESGGAVVIVHGGYAERDEAMTRASHYDILRYRTEEELRARYGARYRQRISGTQKNEIRRQQGVGLPWHGTERLGERKDVKEEKDLNEKKTIGMGMMTKEDEVNTFGSPPPYSEKL